MKIEYYVNKDGCIDCILQIVHCELAFFYNNTAVHMIAYCSLNTVPSAEVFGFCEMYFNYDNTQVAYIRCLKRK